MNLSAATASTPHPPSVLVIARKEDTNLRDCIESCLQFSDDVVVLDASANDRTAQITEGNAAVRVVRRACDSSDKQLNYGLHEITYRHPWLYLCYANERVPAALAQELVARSSEADSSDAAYRVRGRTYFGGRSIQRAADFPQWSIRLVQPHLANFQGGGASPVVRGTVGDLREHFERELLSSGFAQWLRTRNDQSSTEAQRRANRGGAVRGGAMWAFIRDYIFRGGFLNGGAGFHYCAMNAFCGYWVDIKIKELAHPWNDQNEQLAAQLLAGAGKSGAQNMQAPPLVDVMIPTLNEAHHIKEVVANCLPLGPVHVLDSHSTDGTQELARRAGATVVEHTFVNYAQQKNWGLENLPLTGQWVLIIDADERVTPQLQKEILAKLSSGATINGYYINRMLLFMGKAVRHGGLYPSWNLRLFRRGKASYENRAVHEHVICEGQTAFLESDMLHIRRESIWQFLDKHIRYAELESDEWIKARTGAGGGAPSQRLFRHALRYRQWLRRNMWPRLPFRPLSRWGYIYIVRLGFLDGVAGWHLAWLMACYEYMISLMYRHKLAALTQQAQAPRAGSNATAAKSPSAKVDTA